MVQVKILDTPLIQNERLLTRSAFYSCASISVASASYVCPRGSAAERVLCAEMGVQWNDATVPDSVIKTQLSYTATTTVNHPCSIVILLIALMHTQLPLKQIFVISLKFYTS